MPWKYVITVGPIRQLHGGGYTWKVTGHDCVTKTYFTDSGGSGLWIEDDWDGSSYVMLNSRYSPARADRQLLGTAQFNLPSNATARRKKVVMYFTRQLSA